MSTSRTVPTTRLRAVVGAVVGTALVGGLGACGGSGGQDAVSRTPVSSTPTQTATEDPLASDVDGRRHDVGVVVDTATHRGVTLLTLDRWTVRDVDDATLARDGVPVTPQPDDGRYRNQNSERTYAVPVRTGAIAVRNECVVGEQSGLRSEPVPVAEWLEDDHEDEVVLLTYDDEGRLERLDTVPYCSD